MIILSLGNNFLQNVQISLTEKVFHFHRLILTKTGYLEIYSQFQTVLLESENKQDHPHQKNRGLGERRDANH